ncbi:unnamed protein product [Acanthoscelides obtectus]|uniref:Uncharacterized protein n=1 Tax=Acanthoscelides obtectus TaxID=200917 RepID=A0A9P0Q7P6_ACAOB|nr:unnamed protein product [Acanthoscelides obtectus]CAK1678383.1 hypothetical protein AOBTE_LOCUS31855 [Acanthoscelides obtectus]
MTTFKQGPMSDFHFSTRIKTLEMFPKAHRHLLEGYMVSSLNFREGRTLPV